VPSKRIETTSETIGEILAMLIILGPAAPFILLYICLIFVGREIRSFFNRKELSVFEDYVRKLNEFGVGKFEWKRFGRKVTVMHEGVPVAIYKHYNGEIVFPILGKRYWISREEPSDEEPSDRELQGAFLVGCLASPFYAKLKEQERSKNAYLVARFFCLSKEQVIFQILRLRDIYVDYTFTLPAVDMDTDPESYLVYLDLYASGRSFLDFLYAPYFSPQPDKVARIPYTVLAQCGLPEHLRYSLHRLGSG
jgi:hypothetical protein